MARRTRHHSSHRFSRRDKDRSLVRLVAQCLEPRQVLFAGGSGNYDQVDPVWFQSVSLSADFQLPIGALDSGIAEDWIVRLSPQGVAQFQSPQGLASEL